jgi:hypothetical protein
MGSDKRSSPEQWRLEDILKYLDVDDEHEAEEILHSILTSTRILTWNGKEKSFTEDIIYEELTL